MAITGARMATQKNRIAQLSKQVEALEHSLEHDHDYHDVVNDFERRMDHIEGEYVRCGSYSCTYVYLQVILSEHSCVVNVLYTVGLQGICTYVHVWFGTHCDSERVS